jgi:eukaryotic-like serine/threonine-protein kinase
MPQEDLQQEPVQSMDRTTGGNHNAVQQQLSVAEIQNSNVNIAGGNILQNITNYFSGDTEQQRALRNRQNMLHLVWNTWIEGVLASSLHNEILIELGLETHPEAVDYPWDMVVQMPEQQPSAVPPGTKMLDLFDHANGSLLILGEPGCGKTTMLLELARQAIERARQDPLQCIPVVFNLSTWKPHETIAVWLVDELHRRYAVSSPIGQPWVKNNDLLLLLDGLDEVQADHRRACVDAINAFRETYGGPLVICCRRQEYQDLSARLTLQCAVLIQPLDEEQIKTYLEKVGSALIAPYQSLVQCVEQINSTSEERDFLRTPLFLSILAITYQDAPLSELTAITSLEDYRRHLFDAYIAKMFKRRGKNLQFAPEDALKWLAWLAAGMRQRRQALFYLEELDSNWLPYSPQKRGLSVGLSGGLIFGLGGGLISGLFFGLINYIMKGPLLTGIGYGLIAAVIGVIGYGLMGEASVSLMDKSRGETAAQSAATETKLWASLKNALHSGLIAGVCVGLVFGLNFGLLGGLSAGLGGGVIGGLLAGLSVGLIGGLSSKLSVRPAERLNWVWVKARSGLGFGLSFGLLFGLASGLIVALCYGLVLGLIGDLGRSGTVGWLLAWVLSGLELGAGFGLVFALLGGLMGGLMGGLSVSTVAQRNKPGAGIRASLKNAFIFSLIGGVPFGVICALASGGLNTGLNFGLQGLIIWGLICVLIGLLFGFSGAMIGCLYGGGQFLLSHASSTFLLSRANLIPGELIPFLDYCTERIFLRRAGGGYVFIHRMLLDHFAALPAQNVRENVYNRLLDVSVNFGRGKKIALVAVLIALTALMLILNPGIYRAPITGYYRDQALSAAKKANAEQAYQYAARAVQWSPTGEDWNSLCWYGSLAGHAQEALRACDQAVSLQPENAGWRDSRALARALTGDYAGAIEDYQYFVDWLKQYSNENILKIRQERESWIAALKAGQNPFDTETLKALLKE